MKDAVLTLNLWMVSGSGARKTLFWLTVGALMSFPIATGAILMQRWSENERYLPDNRLFASSFGRPEYITLHRGPSWQDYVKVGGFPAECVRKSMVYNLLHESSQTWVWAVKVKDVSPLRLPVFWFPAWLVKIDGIETESYPDTETGLITVSLKPGEHRLVLSWKSMIEEMIGFVVSRVAVLLITLVGGLRLRRTVLSKCVECRRLSKQ
jgi:hypothetical protein